MAVFTTEGIILKRSNFGEADRILTILTPYRGKINVIAKGVRRITSRRSGSVELLNKVRLHLFQGKGMPVLTEAESMQSWPKLKSSITLSTYGIHLSEIANRLIPDGQLNPGVYDLLAATLSLLEDNPRQIFIRAYEVKILSQLGFWSINQINASEETKQLLNKLEKSSWSQIQSIDLNSSQAMELERVLRYYIEKILEGSLKSAQVIDKLKNGK